MGSYFVAKTSATPGVLPVISHSDHFINISIGEEEEVCLDLLEDDNNTLSSSYSCVCYYYISSKISSFLLYVEMILARCRRRRYPELDTRTIDEDVERDQ